MMGDGKIILTCGHAGAAQVGVWELDIDGEGGMCRSYSTYCPTCAEEATLRLVERAKAAEDKLEIERALTDGAHRRAKAAEDKLEKAVDALGFYATLIGEKHECPWHMLSDDFGEKARAALAELGDRDMCKNFTELREGEG